MYPALAVLQTIDTENAEVLWIGSDDGMEAELVQRAGIKFEGIPSAGLHGVNLLTIPQRLYKLVKGYFASKKILKEFEPDVLFLTGGYVGFPMAVAARNLPQVLFVPDIEPGMALNQLGKIAKLITVVCEDSGKFFPKAERIEVVGYPVRAELARWDREEALNHFGLDHSKPVLFVFGGSKGALSINRAVMKNLEELVQTCQVLHVTGKTGWEEVETYRASLNETVQADYHIYPYLHEDMGAAFTAADLVVSRSGASTLGEFPLFGVPAILVPYPYAWRYQKVNAEYLADRNAAVMIRDEELAEKLTGAVTELMTEEKLAEMKANMSALACPDAAKKIADLLKEMSEK